MDAKREGLRKKLDKLLAEAASLAAALQALDQEGRTPHFDEIEMPAHELGKQFSRMVQVTRAREVATEGLQDSACPGCGEKCGVDTEARDVHSIDGPIDLMETKAFCRHCRRSFFPSACGTGL